MPDVPDQTKPGLKDPRDGKQDNPVESDDVGSAKRSYYYDDTHGYKDFDPDDENDQTEEDDED
jgi:hypothetical protein